MADMTRKEQEAMIAGLFAKKSALQTEVAALEAEVGNNTDRESKYR